MKFYYIKTQQSTQYFRSYAEMISGLVYAGRRNELVIEFGTF